MEINIHTVPLVIEGHKFLRIESLVAIITPAGPGVIRSVKVKALWDTGATNTYIPMDVALRMGIPLGEPAMVDRMKSTEPSRYCQFYLQFPTGETIFVPEAIAIPKMQSRFIIGMDVISKGTTAIKPDGEGGVHFSFTL